MPNNSTHTDAARDRQDAGLFSSLAEIAALLTAQGLIAAHDIASHSGSVLSQDAAMPGSLRRASALISRLCIESSVEDLGACVHTISDKACTSMAQWGLPTFAAPFRFSDAVLLDRDTGVPTDDCREMAVLAGGGGELAAQEFFHHDRLRNAVGGRPPRERNSAYEAIRSFVVRNPAVRSADLIDFVSGGNHAAALQVVQSFYRNVPQTARFGSVARRCAYCRSLLWPDRDTVSFPGGKCRIRQCRNANPSPKAGEEIGDPSTWRVV